MKQASKFMLNLTGFNEIFINRLYWYDLHMLKKPDQNLSKFFNSIKVLWLICR